MGKRLGQRCEGSIVVLKLYMISKTEERIKEKRRNKNSNFNNKHFFGGPFNFCRGRMSGNEAKIPKEKEKNI